MQSQPGFPKKGDWLGFQPQGPGDVGAILFRQDAEPINLNTGGFGGGGGDVVWADPAQSQPTPSFLSPVGGPLSYESLLQPPKPSGFASTPTWTYNDTTFNLSAFNDNVKTFGAFTVIGWQSISINGEKGNSQSPGSFADWSYINGSKTTGLDVFGPGINIQLSATKQFSIWGGDYGYRTPDGFQLSNYAGFSINTSGSQHEQLGALTYDASQSSHVDGYQNSQLQIGSGYVQANTSLVWSANATQQNSLVAPGQFEANFATMSASGSTVHSQFALTQHP